MIPVVMIRHPAAFAGSLKVKNWAHPFSHFIAQPLLMNEYLKPFENEIKEFAKTEKNIIDQAALLWKLIYYVVLKYKKFHPEWIYVRHEDLTRNPLDGFRVLYEKLDLDFSEQIAEIIKTCCENSFAFTHTWKERLTSSEIEYLKSELREISEEFYSEDEW
jgi:hypothetical protein